MNKKSASTITSAILAITVSASVMAVNDEQKKRLAWYGDFDGNTVYKVNLHQMEIKDVTTNASDGPYGMEPAGDDHRLWVLPRTSHNLDELENRSGIITQRLNLGYQPREVHTNPSKTYAVVSGRDINAHTVIRIGTTGQNEIVKHFNRDAPKVTIMDFGGQNATGHPFFLNDDLYMILDRVYRKIRIYSVSKGRRVQTISLPTSMHHTIRKGDSIFVSLEGSKTERPGVIRFHYRKNRPDHPLVRTGTARLEQARGKRVAKETMGVHHINFHPDGKHIYAGSAEGNMFVINSNTMAVVDDFPIGKGAGHTDFAPNNGLTVVTAHEDTFVTVVNSKNPTNNIVLKKVYVAAPSNGNGRPLQGHTQAISEDENWFWGASTNDGDLFKVNLSNLKLQKKLNLNNAYLQQGFMYLSPEGAFGNNPQQ